MPTKKRKKVPRVGPGEPSPGFSDFDMGISMESLEADAEALDMADDNEGEVGLKRGQVGFLDLPEGLDGDGSDAE